MLKDCLIIVEGNTDKDFIALCLEYFNIDYREKNLIISQGKDNLKSLASKIKKAESIKIVFDADNNLKDSKESIEKQLEQIEQDDTQEIKSKCEIFLFPNNQDKGNLETLIENIAKEQCILKCFDNYQECISKLNNINIKLPPKKTKIFAYLNCFGFKNGVKDFKLDDNMLDLNSTYITPLKDFLLK